MKLPTDRNGDGDDKPTKKKSSSGGSGSKKAPEVPPGLEHFHSKYPKPTHSYSYLITTAILENPQQQMTLNEIYEWVMERYPWYRTAINGWKVSNHSTCLVSLSCTFPWILARDPVLLLIVG